MAFACDPKEFNGPAHKGERRFGKAFMPIWQTFLAKYIGDLFAWLSMGGLVVLTGITLARRRQTEEARGAEAPGEPLPVS